MNFTKPLDININYVNGFFIPIIYFLNNIVVTGCNKDLFGQVKIICKIKIEKFVCLNPTKKQLNKPFLEFFAVCKSAAYTFFNNNDVNVNKLKKRTITYCIGIFYNAFT